MHSDNNEASPELITMIKDLIKKHSCDREVFDMICEIVGSEPNEEQAFYEDYVKGRSNFKKWKQDNEKIDNYKEKHLYPAYLIRVFYEEYGNRIKQLPTEKMHNLIEMSDESNKNKTKTIAYMESLPGFNIHNRLVFEIYNNPDKEVHKHDFNDLAYMRVAVPYCDMVIGENYWSDRVRHYGFDVKYNTVITTELFKLLEKQWSV